MIIKWLTSWFGWLSFGVRPSCAVDTQSHKSMGAGRWNACIKLLCRPLDSLDAIQRPAALVFRLRSLPVKILSFIGVISCSMSLHAQVHFTNPQSVTIPVVGPGSLYPSPIVVTDVV